MNMKAKASKHSPNHGARRPAPISGSVLANIRDLFDDRRPPRRAGASLIGNTMKDLIKILIEKKLEDPTVPESRKQLAIRNMNRFDSDVKLLLSTENDRESLLSQAIKLMLSSIALGSSCELSDKELSALCNESTQTYIDKITAHARGTTQTRLAQIVALVGTMIQKRLSDAKRRALSNLEIARDIVDHDYEEINKLPDCPAPWKRDDTVDPVAFRERAIGRICKLVPRFRKLVTASDQVVPMRA